MLIRDRDVTVLHVATGIFIRQLAADAARDDQPAESPPAAHEKSSEPTNACPEPFACLATFPLSAPEGIRTPNLLIRSQMLYPLSYGR